MPPNLITPYLIMLTTHIAQAIPLEEALSYLGLGRHRANAGVGTDAVRQRAIYFLIAPWLVIFPGIAISFAVIAFDLFGNAVRDFLNPRLRK